MPTPPARLLRLHHAQITYPIDGEGRAREFYCGLLGLREIPKPEVLQARGGFWLELGSLQVHCSVEDGVDRKATKAHLAYQVEDLESWRTLLVSKGFSPQDGTPIPGMVRFEFRDPFGNRIEFLELRAS